MIKTIHLTHTDIDSDSRILKEMEALAKCGYSVSGIGVLADARHKGAKGKRVAQTNVIDLISRRFRYLPDIVRHAITFIELLVRMIPMVILTKPDIIHCHDTVVLPVGVLVKIFNKSKVIYDAHELESDRNGLKPIERKLIYIVEKICWRYIDGLIVVSPSINNWYNNKFGYKKNAVVMNSPNVHDFYDDSDNYLRNKFSIPKDCKIFVYVGIFAVGRGIDLILEAFKCKDVTSHVVFMGYGELYEELRSISNSRPNVHVHKSVPHDRVVPIVRSADYGICLVQNVSLSDYYCLPNKLFEYCFAHVPVLASNFPDIRGLVKEHDIGVVCEPNVKDLTRLIVELQCQDPKFDFNNLQKLTWASQADKLQSLYVQVLAR